MNKFLTLLKYVDRSKVTPEAVTEILTTFDVRLHDAARAAEIATAYRTRGTAGLLPFLPELLSQRAPKQDTSAARICPNCGTVC